MTNLNTSTPGGRIMPQITTDNLEPQRKQHQKITGRITNDVATEIRDVDLGSIPVYLVIPNSGEGEPTCRVTMLPLGC
jgi:hypothetical protein